MCPNASCFVQKVNTDILLVIWKNLVEWIYFEYGLAAVASSPTEANIIGVTIIIL